MHTRTGYEGVWSVDISPSYKNIMASGGSDAYSIIYIK
jgi:hypothetical protein